MVTDRQVRDLFRFLVDKKPLTRAARLTDMDDKTARKYRDLGKLPSDIAKPHDWATRANPFDGVWDDVRALLDVNPGLQAKTIFIDLQRQHPGKFADVEKEVHRAFAQMADQVVAGLLAEATADAEFAKTAQKK